MSVLFEVADHVGVVTLNRPNALNAVNREMMGQLSDAWNEIRDNPDIWCAILTSAGTQSFSVGADVKEPPGPERTLADLWQPPPNASPHTGFELWKPVIAAVNGHCLGLGMLLLMATDIRVAGENATFGIPEVRLGFNVSAGGTQRTLRQLPYAVAMELLLTGDPMDARRAFEVGLVNYVEPPEAVLDRAHTVARRLTRNPPIAMRALKELVVRGQDGNLQDGMRLEAAFNNLLRRSEDAEEGRRAFLEKRDPQFRGR